MTKAENFYYPNGVPRNKLGLDDAEVLSMIERDMSVYRLEQIRAGEAPEATRGNFDLEHLKAIHQHTMQDTYEWAGVTRNETMTIEGREFKAAPLLWKEGSQQPFTPSDEVNASLNRTFAELQEKSHLQGLTREDFSREGAKTFSEINQAHPFMEGNGRTQREFMRQLGEQAGYPLNFDLVEKERMNQVSEQARIGDRAGLEQVFQEITPQDVPQVQHENTLKDLSREDFTRQAAQELTRTVKADDLTPEQVRQAAADLGERAERPLNLEVITEERWRHDTALAQQDYPEGFERMFQETSDPQSAKLLQRAIENLEQRDVDTSQLYLTVARPGQGYSGHLEFKTSRVGVVVNAEGQHLATPSSSLKGMSEGPVKFTAQEPTKMQQHLDY